jgi:hypothetical protein
MSDAVLEVVLDAGREMRDAAAREASRFDVAPPVPVDLTGQLETEFLIKFGYAVANDAQLAPLWQVKQIQHSDGGGNRWQVGQLLPELLRATRDRLRVPNPDFDEETWLAGLVDTVGQLRALVAGETVVVPVRVGLIGLPLPTDFTLDLGALGLLRNPYRHEKERNAARRHPSAVVVRQEHVSVQFDCERPETTWIGARWRDDDDPHLVAASRLCLAAVVAMPAPYPRWFSPSLSSFAAMRPLSGFSDSARFYTGPDRSDTSAQLPTEMLSGLARWCQTVMQHYNPSVGVADDRLRSALRRTGGSDGLIDAVIAWENLVGASGEQRFRISAALAVLTERDAAKRRGLQRRLAKLYDLRSQLVHGNSIEQSRLDDGSREAIAVAAQAMRSLFAEHPELLSDPERGTRLLLGDVA